MTLSYREKSILWTFFFVSWTVIWIRAAIIPVFPDEVFSWFLYGESGYFFGPAAQVDANNHVLNSMLVWVSAKIFGTSALAIRLPNVLAFVVFFISVVGISRFQKTNGGFWISVFTLCGIFYILEFFSLSRGYGLSFAFALFTVWQFLCYQRNLRLYRLVPTGLGMTLTLSSNLSFIFTCGALLAWVFLLLLTAPRPAKQKSLAPHWLIALAMAAVLFVFYRYLSFLNESGMLYYGVKGGFPLETVKTLVIEMFGRESCFYYVLLLVVFLLILFAFVFILLRQKIMESIFDARLVFAVLLFANIAGITYTVWFMDAVAPSDRTAAHLILLFLGAILFLKPSFDNRVLISYVQPLLLLFPLLTLPQFNLKMHHFWRDDQLSSRIYNRLLAETKNEKKPVTISGFRYFDRMYAFENTRRNNRLPTFDLVSWPNNRADYLLIRKYDFREHKPDLEKNYTVLVRDNVSGNMLLKRNRRLKSTFTARSFHRYEPGASEYLDFVSIRPGQNSPRDIVVEVDFRFTFSGSGEQFILTSGITDTLGNQIAMTEHLHLNQLKSEWGKAKRTHFTIPFFNLPATTGEIKIYLYNDKKVPHGRFNAQAKIYSLEN